MKDTILQLPKTKFICILVITDYFCADFDSISVLQTAKFSHQMFHIQKMVIISKTALNDFSQKHSDTIDVLNEWYNIVKIADWKDHNALKNDFPSADYVRDNRFVFNIKGNRYRLVALVFFSVRTVYIKFIGTHAEYNKIDVLTIDMK